MPISYGSSDITFDDPAKQTLLESIGLASLKKEVQWLRQQLESDSHGKTSASRVVKDLVFSHQDLLCGNILYSDKWDRVQFIDFEYGGYNLRAFDIANHFCEYAGYDPNYTVSYPDKDKQIHFFRSYFAALPSIDFGE